MELRKSRPIPGTVRLICAIVVLIPVIESITRVQQRSSGIVNHNVVFSNLALASGCLVGLLIAGGLARGWSWLRWLFVVVVTCGLMSAFFAAFTVYPIIVGAPPPLPTSVGLVIWTLYAVAITLFITSSARAHFRDSRLPNQSKDPAA